MIIYVASYIPNMQSFGLPDMFENEGLKTSITLVSLVLPVKLSGTFA